MRFILLEVSILFFHSNISSQDKQKYTFTQTKENALAFEPFRTIVTEPPPPREAFRDLTMARQGGIILQATARYDT